MKSIKYLLLAILIIFPSKVFSYNFGLMKTNLIEGDVQIYNRDVDDWVAASINMPLLEGDRIWVPENSRLEIHVKGRTYVRLDEMTSFDILTAEEMSLRFYLARGHVYINDRRGAIDILQIDTPLASVSIYDDSIAMVDVSDDGKTEVSVLRGYVYVESANGRIRIEAGKSIVVEEDRYASIFPLGPAGEWERWNRQRDRRLEEVLSSRYLPDELREYSYDFDRYGRWIYTRDYGYVWTPTVIVSVGWAPYKTGRWVWLRGHYVWIPYEPWGWVPHHYGRWTFIIGIGWCWVPPFSGYVYWGPGYVGWVYTPYYIAWVPLAPYEIYYGYGYYGPWSVNIVNINIKNVVIKEYKNVNIKNAVTVIHRDTFIRGKKVDIKIDENPFKKERVSIGPPDIKPEKETRLPIIKQIPETRRPDEKIKKINTEEIKKERRFSKQQDESVFKPERKVEQLPVKEFKKPQKRIHKKERGRINEKEPEIEIREERKHAPDKKIDRGKMPRTPEDIERPAHPKTERRRDIRMPDLEPETRAIPPSRIQKEQREKKVPEPPKERIEDTSGPTQEEDALKEEMERKKRKRLQDRETMQPIPSRPQ